MKYFSWIGCLALGLQTAWGFSLIGPLSGSPGGQAWQVPTIGYGLPGDLGTPRNLAEEYRRTTPVMFYACDASFLDYFGSNGAVAIDQSFNLLNGVLTNGVDSYDYSSQTSTNRFPFETLGNNATAGILDLVDLKSALVFEMMEQLGLADSVRYTWTLTDRHAVAGNSNACPANIEYSVVQYNFDPVTWAPSSFVDNTLWSYLLPDNCTGNPNPEADAVEITSSTPINFPVASQSQAFLYGGFYTNLTWDDVGGLKYIYSTNNWNNETPFPGSSMFSTNFNTLPLLTTSNYNALVSAATTNDPVTLQTLYPGLVVNSVPSYYSNIVSIGGVTFVTNFPYGYPGGIVAAVTNYTTNLVLIYQFSFGNVVTNKVYSKTSYAIQTITFGPQIGQPAGGQFVLTTNTSAPFQSNVVSGDFFILTNGACGPDFIKTEQTNVNIVTNTTVLAVNPNGTFFQQSLISYFTNYTFSIHPCTLVTNGQNLYQGIGKIRFVKTTFDSLLGQYYQPFTNQYTMVLVTNSQFITEAFQRVVTAPDFLISASNIITGPDALLSDSVYSRGMSFTPDTGYALPGPGTINSAMAIFFNKIGNSFFQLPSGDTNIVLNEGNQINTFFWGSFDASTNMNVYPTNTDIQNLIYQAAIHITPSPPTLPDATNGAAYALTFTTTGGAFTPPDSWSLTQGGGGLPPGLGLSVAGTISGTPTQSGTFDNIIIQMSDSLGRTVRWGYSMTVH